MENLNYFSNYASNKFNSFFKGLFWEKNKQGLEGIEFPGAVKWKLAEFLEVIQKRSGISRGYQEKHMWNFLGVLCLTLEFPGGDSKILQNFQGWSFLRFINFQRQSEKLKNCGVFFQKCMSSTPRLLCSGKAQTVTIFRYGNL